MNSYRKIIERQILELPVHGHCVLDLERLESAYPRSALDNRPLHIRLIEILHEIDGGTFTIKIDAIMNRATVTRTSAAAR